MNAPTLALLLALAGCDEGTCMTAPELHPRAACRGTVTLEVVLHTPTTRLNDERLAADVEDTNALLEPHGVRLELVAHEVSDYWPVLDARACDAFAIWEENVAIDDGRVHVWAMAKITRPDGLTYEGLARGTAIAIVPHAVDHVMAHEFGHVLGLHHVPDDKDPHDIMNPIDVRGSTGFTDEQGATMRAHACALEVGHA